VLIMSRHALLFTLLAALPGVAEEPPDPPPGPDTYDPRNKVSLTTSDIMEVVLSNKSALSECIVAQRKADPAAKGKLLVRWRVFRNGETHSIEFASPEHADTVVGQCVAGLIKRWRFPKHQRLSEPITFPFKF
jgi:hypothetical protein